MHKARVALKAVRDEPSLPSFAMSFESMKVQETSMKRMGFCIR